MANSTTVLFVLLIVCNVPAVLDNCLSEEKSADTQSVFKYPQTADNVTSVVLGTYAFKDDDVSTKPEQAQASCMLENIHAETSGNILPERVAGNDTGRRRPAFSNDLIAEIQFDFTKGLQNHVTINLNQDRILDIILSPPSQTSAPRKTTLPESVQNSRLWDILSSHLHTIYLHSVHGQVTLSVQLHLDWVALVHSRLTQDDHEAIQVAGHGQNFLIPFNRTVHDSDTNTTDPLEMSNSNDFPSFPRRPSGPNVFQESTPAKYSSVDHSPTRSATLPETSRRSSKGQVLFNAIVVICLLLKFLQWIRPESLAEKEKHQRKGTYISILTHLFFLNWHWRRTQHSTNEPVAADQTQETSEEGKRRTWAQNMDSSEKNVLKQIIFRPWLNSVFTGNGSVKSETNSKPHLKKPKDTHTGEDAGDCRSFASKICSACQRRLDEFRSKSQKTSERQQGKESHENVQESPLHPHVCKAAEHLESHHCHQQQRHHGDHLHHQQQFIIVNPASRYLPDPTCDPAIDLVHVGYRLATLSALSAAMPISRIRLADAGFYFGGRGDEVTCYSCGRSHAGWARGDNPMEVHRRLHPDCEHVLQVDRLTQALNSNQNSENVGDGRGGPVSHTENRAAGSNPPAEDGEESGTRSRRRTDQRHQTPERNASQRTPPSPANTDRRPQTPQPTVSRPTGAASRNSPSAQETERTASSTATSTQRSATSNLPITQPSTNESVRNATSANQSQPTESNANRQNQSATSNVNPSPDANARAATTVHGQASGAESNPEARPLFPRAGLDLSGAVYPMYQDMQSRRRTFTTWNERNAPSLDQIILSGMFYAGYADCVRCFYCGVGLKHWVATDDVMTEHVRWRPGCEYLRTIKGDDFIRDVQQRLALQTSGSTGTNIGDSGNATPRATTTAAAATNNSSSPSSSSTSAATSAPVNSAATSASVRSATAAGASVTTTTTTSASSSPSSSSPTTATTTSNASSSSSLSANTLSAPSSTTSTSNNRPEASSATVTTTTSQATATTSSSSSARGDGATPSTTGHTSGSTSAVSSAAEDSETLDQLQAENRALEERFRCRVCHQGTINTILMPCGHLVACEDCARTVTSCPLCHDPIRATARVYLA